MRENVDYGIELVEKFYNLKLFNVRLQGRN